MSNRCDFCDSPIESTNAYCSKACYGQDISNKITKECPVCSKEITTTPSKDKTYCSKECSGKANRNGKYVSCENCGEIVWKQQNEIKRSINNFCSNECNNEYQKVSTHTITCENCNRAFSVKENSQRRFCSRECSGKHSETEPVIVQCHNCGERVERHQYYAEKFDNTYCSTECRSKWLQENSLFASDENPRLKDGRYGEFGANWPEMRDKARNRANKTCENCGKSREENSRALSVHHIKPRSEFINSDDKVVEESNTIENLIALCRSCHMKAEHGVITT